MDRHCGPRSFPLEREAWQPRTGPWYVPQSKLSHSVPRGGDTASPGFAGTCEPLQYRRSQPPAPAADLAPGDPQPGDQEDERNSRATGPASDELDNRVTGRLGNPGSVQSSPSSFFSLICSSMSGADTLFVTQIRHRNAFQEVKPRKGDLFLRRDALPDSLGHGETSARNCT